MRRHPISFPWSITRIIEDFTVTSVEFSLSSKNREKCDHVPKHFCCYCYRQLQQRSNPSFIMTSILHQIIFLAASATLFHETMAFLSPNAHHSQDGRKISDFILISSSPTTQSSLPLFSMDFKQHPGERDIDFIKRITSNTNAMVNESKAAASPSSMPTTSNSTDVDKKVVYKRIEEWDEERMANGELSWEEKVQFDGQRFGNQVKQDHILRHHIGTFF